MNFDINEVIKLTTNATPIEKVLHIALYIIGILIVYLIVDKYVTKAIYRFYDRNKNMSERKAKTLKLVTVNIFKVLLIFVTIVAILNLFGVDPTSIIALFSVFSLAVGLAAQNVIKDFIAGFLLLIEDQFALHDTIVINNDVTGVVENLGLRTTSLRTIDGELYIVPNGYIQTIKTFSKEFSRAKVVVGVDYATNIDECLKILKNEMEIAMDDIAEIKETPEVQGIVALGDNAVNIRILAVCDIDAKWEVERELLRRIKNRLDKENISIPFPQRVIRTVKEWF